MREIKFRAWDKQQLIMFYYDCHSGNPIYIKFNGNMVSIDNNGEEYSDGDLILIQYTGLKDKNGKEIYEGDIIRGIYGKELPNEIALIYWDDKESGFIVHWRDDDSRMGISEFFSKIEIIGNIYENPELLEPK